MSPSGPLYLVGSVIDLILVIYLGILLARVVLSWMPMLVQGWTPRGPVLVIAEVVYTLTDPPLRFLDRFLPPVRIGQVSLSLAFIALSIGIVMLRILNQLLLMR